MSQIPPGPKPNQTHMWAVVSNAMYTKPSANELAKLNPGSNADYVTFHIDSYEDAARYAEHVIQRNPGLENTIVVFCDGSAERTARRGGIGVAIMRHRADGTLSNWQFQSYGSIAELDSPEVETLGAYAGLRMALVDEDLCLDHTSPQRVARLIILTDSTNAISYWSEKIPRGPC
ncbi:hypothetical protein F5Y16DRAFT_401448 [Xylariaceae sp. FL0255]|nr:hypothetical protein F5Y16DRAFT_401448 [Xylariaceae sp. FL0255]